MKAILVFLLSLFVPCVLFGTQSAPAWHGVDGRTIQFFMENGFEFLVDESMAKHYEKPTVEISVLIPAQFIDSGLTNTFSSVTILSDELSTDLGTHDHAGKQRIILTLSEAMAKKSKVVFYFRNDRKDVTDGTMYRLNLVQVLDEWKMRRK